ncbi:MAG: ChbG/HpnK family deacetylase [Planctomycetes bacterium]|nr:ChbG/HpnK family deacetylase [Planctomycetota bacterium]
MRTIGATCTTGGPLRRPAAAVESLHPNKLGKGTAMSGHELMMLCGIGGVLVAGWAAAARAGAPAGGAAESDIRLIVRGDDMGAAHAVNEACIRCFRDGVVRTAEVMVPCPWYREAVRMLKENPGLDAGVHLTLTSEWENCRWGPLTRAPSLMDAYGYFFPMTGQRPDFPPGTGFLQAGPKPEEVEQELRAQISRAKADIPQVSHLTDHMGAAGASPALRAIAERLAREFGLPLEAPGAKRAPGLGGAKTSPEEKEETLLRTIENLAPGTWILVDHPGLDVPEMQALGHKGYETVARDRAGVTRAFTSERVKRAIQSRGVRLMSYAEFHRK